MTRTQCPNYPPLSCPYDCRIEDDQPCWRGLNGGRDAPLRLASKVPTLRPPVPPAGEPDLGSPRVIGRAELEGRVAPQRDEEIHWSEPDQGMVVDFGTDKALYVPPDPDLGEGRPPAPAKDSLPEFIATTQIGGYFKGDGHRYVKLADLRTLLREHALAIVDLTKVEKIANPPSDDHPTMAGRYTVLLALCRGVIE